MKKFFRFCLIAIFLWQGYVAFGQQDSIFSDIEFLGDSTNYTVADTLIWQVFTDSTNMEVVYGIVQDKPYGGVRRSILNERMYGAHDYFVSADMKLQKRPSAVAETAWWEDGVLFFAYKDANNYAQASFFNTHGPAKDSPVGQGDALGLSGFKVIVNGMEYRMTHSDTPEDLVEEIPAETCIPFAGDTSFYDWNKIMVQREGSTLSMLVNGKVYHSVSLTAETEVEFYSGGTLDSIDVIPTEVLALLLGSGQIGIGSANDRVYFDNVDAGDIPVTGIFSNIDFFGDAGNYTEVNPWLWDVFDEDGDAKYGIVEDKPAGGNRTSILNEKMYGAHDYFVSADMKLQKRPSAVAETAWWEDGVLFFAYKDANNYAQASFFNTHGPAKDSPVGQGDALGLSGFKVIVNGMEYRMTHSDTPEDLVEEIPAETCIPFAGDTSFYDWNKIMVQREGSTLSMLVNGKVYHSVSLTAETEVEFYSGGTLDSIDVIPTEVLDLLFTNGQIGIGSSNDRVYFDNVDAGYIEVSGIFNEDEPMLGDAANYMELNPWLWGVVEEDGDTRYGVTAEKAAGGNRKSIYQGMDYNHNYWVSADMKLFKRPDSSPDAAKFEDGVVFFSYIDESNFAQAMFFNTSGVGVEGNPVGQADAFGMSGFRVMYEGQEYRLTKLDDPGDPIEEIAPETCIPYKDDSSFDTWNAIQFERENSIIRMIVEGETYFEIDVDTLTLGQVYSGWQFNHWEELPLGAKDLMLGSGKIGIGSSNDKVLFDNISAGYIGVDGKFSDVEILGEAGNYMEVNPWLWGVIEEDGDTRYGITAEKGAGGNRMSIVEEETLDSDWTLEADVKLFKRPDGSPDQAKFEDAVLYFSYMDEANYAQAMYFNHSGIGVEGNPVGQGDAFGMSGFRVMYEGQEYRITKLDDPGDPLEEIPAERCIPFVDDNSFNDWNNIRLERQGTILSMVVNEEVYWAIDVDTLTYGQVYSGWQFNHWDELPQAALDMLLGEGQFGIGSSNDKVYFDNVETGVPVIINVETSSISGVSIYPNPATDQITVSMMDEYSKVEIYTVSGQKVMEMITNGEHSVIVHVNHLESGVYFIQLRKDSGEAKVEKLIVR